MKKLLMILPVALSLCFVVGDCSLSDCGWQNKENMGGCRYVGYNAATRYGAKAEGEGIDSYLLDRT